MSQLAVTAQIPAGVEVGTTELVSNAAVGEVPITVSAVALITSTAGPTASASPSYGPIAVAESQVAVFERGWFLPVVLALLFLALAAIVALLIGALDTKNRQQGRVKRRLEEVSILGAPPEAAAQVQTKTSLGDTQATRSLVSFADRVAAKRDTTALSRKLESAYVPLRPGEWAVVHVLIGVAVALVATLLSNFNIVVTLLALIIGLVAPWAYLTLRADKREKDFYDGDSRRDADARGQPRRRVLAAPGLGPTGPGEDGSAGPGDQSSAP